MTPTLYPHEVVIKWFKNSPYILITFTTLITGATILVVYTVVKSINGIPSLNSQLIQSNTVYVTSCSSPGMVVVGSLLVVLGIYFSFNLLSRGRLM